MAAQYQAAGQERRNIMGTATETDLGTGCLAAKMAQQPLCPSIAYCGDWPISEETIGSGMGLPNSCPL